MLPAQDFASIDFAQGTPYETHFARASTSPSPVLSPEIVDVVHGLSRDVVLGGAPRSGWRTADRSRMAARWTSTARRVRAISASTCTHAGGG